MFKLIDKAFLRSLFGFVMILIVSFSLLTIFGAWKETKQNYAALIKAFEE